MKIYLDTIGCRLNQSEIEKIGQQFRQAGHTLTDDPAEADAVVVNTCAVTAQAAADSRSKIRAAHRAGNARIIVTGCWSAVDPDGAASLPGVHSVVMNDNKDLLVREFLELTPEVFDVLTHHAETVRQPLPGKHQRTRAFIKAQDGCDNFCTYCITRIARGKARSTPLDTILADIDTAERGGTQEVVLTGVHLASWGQDFTPRQSIADLVRAVLAHSRIPRVRLSSLEPWDLDQAFFTLFEDPRLCRHLHLPLQSGSDPILRRMARKITPAEYARLLDWARQAVPQLAITTDIIVAFPGETETEFAESLEFVRRMQFADGHVFGFSPRKGTPAADYAGQVAKAVRKERSTRMRAVLEEARQQYQRQFIGTRTSVLWETALPEGGQWRLGGLTDNYLRVSMLTQAPRHNQIDDVNLRSLREHDFEAVPTGEEDSDYKASCSR
ncbi:MAG: tRNA (N(6)-L-threonylcarbamoyladenosine(37)-C(2))-methylthiotransferase MtaB [Anaerolineae bacterium]|nr:tRNA (N(6)-L-threonylcarbamoyladenosine(37)-C(2))-methylthiotransferase MtaB [Anaerolineae bacterium]